MCTSTYVLALDTRGSSFRLLRGVHCMVVAWWGLPNNSHVATFVTRARSNYCGTKHLLDLAALMLRLRAFVYVSTYYVSNFKPYNTPVKEEVHNIMLQLPGTHFADLQTEVDVYLA